MIYGDLKKYWVDFIIGWLCTFQFKHVKVNFASDDPFKTSDKLLIFEQ